MFCQRQYNLGHNTLAEGKVTEFELTLPSRLPPALPIYNAVSPVLVRCASMANFGALFNRKTVACIRMGLTQIKFQFISQKSEVAG